MSARLLTVLSLLLAAGCAATAAPQGAPDPARDITEISLTRRTFGGVSESIVLHRDGRATRTVFGNARAGTQDVVTQATQADGAFAALAAAVIREKFLELQPLYTDPRLADGTTTTIAVRRGDAAAEVAVRNIAPPAPFAAIQSVIEQTAAALTWR